MIFALTMAGLLVASFVQNAAFTAVSRSRNSGDVAHHMRCSVASNGVWFTVQIFLWSSLWRSVEAGELWQIAVAGVVYVAGTTAGSCWMMARMLRSETGKQREGSR